MLKRGHIIAEAERSGLVRSGFDFIDKSRGICINSAVFISTVRKLSSDMEVPKAIEKIIIKELNKQKS